MVCVQESKGRERERERALYLGAHLSLTHTTHTRLKRRQTLCARSILCTVVGCVVEVRLHITSLFSFLLLASYSCCALEFQYGLSDFGDGFNCTLEIKGFGQNNLENFLNIDGGMGRAE